MENLATVLRSNPYVHTLALLLRSDDRKIPALVVPGEQAVPQWKLLRQLFSETGYWPVLLGDKAETERVVEGVQAYDAGRDEILSRATAIDSQAWLREREQELVADYGKEWLEGIHGAWADGGDKGDRDQFQTPRDILTRKFKPAVTIALVPAKTCWEVPAVLRFGGWNECPAADIHLAMSRSWNERHGAEILAVTGDVVEMYAHWPPTQQHEALSLANEMFLYCSDIVTQGTQTIENLAAGLINNHAWFFWWD